MSQLTLYVKVPFATFRESYAREYGKTYIAPPPATVYGMLLSLVGETDMKRHCGVNLAIALLREPEKFRVLRQLRRFKKSRLNAPENQSPAYQEVLSNIELMISIASFEEVKRPNLAERVEQALIDPNSVRRFGCLSLGESNDLVNTLKLVSEDYSQSKKLWLVQSKEGSLTLPYWVDHVGSRNTRWLRYSLEERENHSPPDLAWTIIQSQ
jgi:CRISPR-associated protein Cas5t